MGLGCHTVDSQLDTGRSWCIVAVADFVVAAVVVAGVVVGAAGWQPSVPKLKPTER